MSTYRWVAPDGTDPHTDGGSVGDLTLRTVWDDSLFTLHTVPGPAARPAAGVYEWVLPADLVESRYWPQISVDWAGAGAETLTLPAVDLPDWQATGRVMSPWPVAMRLGVPHPLSDAQQARIADQIGESQGKVEDYLKRPVLPEWRSFTHRQPLSGYPLLSKEAWPDVRRDADDTITVAAATLVGYSYTVDVWVGLNAATDPRLAAVREWVAADAASQLSGLAGAGRIGTRDVSSVSADGQSVSYAPVRGGTGVYEGQAGSPPALTQLARWRRKAVYQRRRYPTPAWPYRWV